MSERYNELVNKLHHYSMLKYTDSDLRALEDGRIMVRAEVQAMEAIMIEKGIMTKEEFEDALCYELDYLLWLLEKKSGFESTDVGLTKEFKKELRKRSE